MLSAKFSTTKFDTPDSSPVQNYANVCVLHERKFQCLTGIDFGNI